MHDAGQGRRLLARVVVIAHCIGQVFAEVGVHDQQLTDPFMTGHIAHFGFDYAEGKLFSLALLHPKPAQIKFVFAWPY